MPDRAGRCATRRFRVGKPSVRPELLAVDHVAGDGVRVAEQRARAGRGRPRPARRARPTRRCAARRASRWAGSRPGSRGAGRLPSAWRHCRRAWRRSRSRSPTISHLTCRPSTSTRAVKSSGVMAAKCALKCSTMTRSMPASASDSSLSRRLAMRVGRLATGRRCVAAKILARMRLEGHHGRFDAEARTRLRARAPAMPGGRGGHRRSCRS